MLVAGFKSYLIRTIYEYCIDHGLLPMITVSSDEADSLLAKFAIDGFVTLDLSNAAVRELTISKDSIFFLTRFQGRVSEINFDIDKVAWMGSACQTCGMSFDFAHKASPQEQEKAMAEIAKVKSNSKAGSKIKKGGSTQPKLRLL